MHDILSYVVPADATGTTSPGTRQILETQIPLISPGFHGFNSPIGGINPQSVKSVLPQGPQ